MIKDYYNMRKSCFFLLFILVVMLTKVIAPVHFTVIMKSSGKSFVNSLLFVYKCTTEALKLNPVNFRL